MTKVELRINENLKYEIIKKLVDTNSNKKTASLKLSCRIRTDTSMAEEHQLFTGAHV